MPRPAAGWTNQPIRSPDAPRGNPNPSEFQRKLGETKRRIEIAEEQRRLKRQLEDLR